MTIRILSDLHYGHPASYIKDFSALAPLVEGVNRLVVNGDATECRFTKEFEKGQANREALRQFFCSLGAEPTFLTGNHDPFFNDCHHLDLADGAVLVTHGDILFPGLSPWSRDAEILRRAQIEALAEAGNPATLEGRLAASRQACHAVKDLGPREYHVNSVRTVRGFFQEIWPFWRPFKMLSCWAQTPSRARSLAERYRPRARFVVVGHTHRAGVWRTGGRLVINTGSFLPLSGRLAVDLGDGEIVIRRIVHRNGRFYPGKEVGRRRLEPLD